MPEGNRHLIESPVSTSILTSRVMGRTSETFSASTGILIVTLINMTSGFVGDSVQKWIPEPVCFCTDGQNVTIHLASEFGRGGVPQEHI